jgi:hypothetical protein
MGRSGDWLLSICSVVLRRNFVFRTIGVVLVFLVLTSCMPQNQVVPTVVSTTLILPATSLPIPSPLPTITPTDSTEPKPLNIACLDVAPEISSSIDLRGKVVLHPLDYKKAPYFLDLQTGSKNNLPYSEVYFADEFSTSPDHKWVAYFVGPSMIESRLVVVDSDGNVIFQKPDNRLQKWYVIDTWLNDQHLMMEINKTLPGISLAIPLPVAVLDPFTGEETNLDNNFPEMVSLYPQVRWDNYGYSASAYDPTMTKVAYASVDSDKNYWTVLRDLAKNQNIVSVHAAADFGNGPVWSPDGSQFVVDTLASDIDPLRYANKGLNSEELLLVSKYGNVTRLTYLADEFDEFSLSGYVWSPDGTRIAMWLSATPSVYSDLPSKYSFDFRLAILDVITKQLTSYCILGSSEFANTIVWSPDGQQLLVNAWNMEKSNATQKPIRNIYDTVLIDLSRNYAAKIADETVPIGWLNDK